MELSQEGIQYLENSIDRGRPVPGQSLTNAKDQPYGWEKPAEMTDPREAMYVVFDSLIEPEAASNVLLSVGSGIGVVDIASVILYTGFIEGKWNPDLMLLLMEPTMYMIMALAEKADIEYVLESGDKFLSDEPSKNRKKSVEKMEKEITTLEDLKKSASSKINSQVIPTEIKEKIEEIELSPSLLEKVGKETQNSLLSRGE
tara:strand:- start:420 stop:1022 length:603 start_codon:yes stop_codon:yes gene_type:complete